MDDVSYFQKHCMCGSYMDEHTWNDGHSPVSMYDYYKYSERKTGMNYSTAVMLINDKIRAVKIIYESEEEKKNQDRHIFKTLDETIKVDDLVVVPTNTRHGFTVVKVKEIDVDVDPDDNTEVKWIVNKVDIAFHVKTLAEEAKWVDALKKSEKRKKREDIRKNMIDAYGPDLENLPIASMSGVAAIENKS